MTANEIMRELRRKLGFNQAKMASELKTSQGYVSKFERGQLGVNLEIYRTGAKLAYQYGEDKMVEKFQEHLFE